MLVSVHLIFISSGMENNGGMEDTEDFFLSCHMYDVQRHDLGTVSAILLSEGLSNLSNETFLKVLLCGDGRLSTDSKSQIIKATLTCSFKMGVA